MDEQHFDELARTVAGGLAPRRAVLRLLGGGVLASVLAAVGQAGVAAETCLDEGAVCHTSDQCCLRHCKKRKGHRTGKCSCPASRQCETFCCPEKRFCCNPQDNICCPNAATCCNPGDGTGSCCAAPGACAHVYGDNCTETACDPTSGGPTVCCPPKRTFTGSGGVPICCPAGTVALGTVTTNGGPCCPEDAVCNGTCCAAGSVCLGGSCCAVTAACGSQCCPTNACWGCVGGTCKPLCTSNQYCAGGTCKDCGQWGCGG
jgi:hypothetical protein